MASQLALFGGSPVRNCPLTVSPVVGPEEIFEVMDVFRANEFSRYAGGPTLDVEELLRLPSADAVTRLLPYWNFLGGRKVRDFEAAFSAYTGWRFAMAVNSATSGLSVALAAAGVGPGDEVICTCLSFTATASAILMFGSVPVFVDVDPRTFCMDPDAVRAAITPRTKAILVVHLLGNATDMDAIMTIAREHDLVVVEDCAQAPGVRYKGRVVGTIGHLGVFSLQETKNLMTGEGGVIVTDNVEYARKCRLIRNHGETVATDATPIEDLVVGYNFRMTEMTAALGIPQLKRLDRNNALRTANAAMVVDRIARLPGLTPPFVPEGVDYQCHVLGLLYDASVTGVARSVVVAALRAEGIPVGTGYTRLLYESPIFLRQSALGASGFPFKLHAGGDLVYRRGACPVAERLIHERFIWIFQVAPPADAADMDDIAGAFEKIYANFDELRGVNPDTVVLEYNR